MRPFACWSCSKRCRTLEGLAQHRRLAHIPGIEVAEWDAGRGERRRVWMRGYQRKRYSRIRRLKAPVNPA